MSHRFKQPFYESFAAELLALLKRERQREPQGLDSIYSASSVQRGDDARGFGKSFTRLGR